VSTVIALLIAVDPIGIGRVWPRRPLAAGVVVLALVTAAVLARPVLDLLDLSQEGFWIAAGLVLLVPASTRIFTGSTRDVAGPAGALVAMALATRDGLAVTIVAAGVTGLGVLGATYLPERRWTPMLERVVGAAMVVIAFDLVRDGVIAV
jgi:small neutral amino acid transporter SnatA (MarC family)